MSTLKTNQIQTTSGEVILSSTGSILQTAFGENTTQVINSANLTYEGLVSVTLTAVKSNSRYFMTGYTHAYRGAASARGNVGFAVQVGGGSLTRLAGVDGTYSDAWGTAVYPGAQLNRSFVYTSSAAAGTNLTFYLLGAGFDGAVTFNYAGYNHKNCITVMEVSA